MALLPIAPTIIVEFHVAQAGASHALLAHFHGLAVAFSLHAGIAGLSRFPLHSEGLARLHREPDTRLHFGFYTQVVQISAQSDRLANIIRGRTSLGSDCTAKQAEAGDDHHFSQELHFCSDRWDKRVEI